MKGHSYDFFAAFSQAQQPEKADVAPHDCTECFDIREDFGDLKPFEIADEVMARRFDSLPLLSSKAWRFYLPAYLDYAVRNPRCELGEYVLIDLEMACGEPEIRDDARLVCLSERERNAVLRFLDMYERRWDDYIEEDREKTIRQHIADIRGESAPE